LPAIAFGPASAAYAADKDKDRAADGKAAKVVEPPASMSSLGGALLGRPGTQVQLKAGAPALPKDVTGRSWIVADAESGEVLAAHNAHWPLPPASTLKMLFADTVLPKFPKTATRTVKPEDLAGIGAGSSAVGVKEHLTYSVHDLWLGVFLRSGNDAVHVLTAMNGGQTRTVAEMQAHASALQALDTKVRTPDGYDEEGQVSSAYDLTLFARSGMQKKDFREYAATGTAQFPGGAQEVKKGEPLKRSTFQIRNTNRLLVGDYDIGAYKGIAGVKNGYTTNAGHTFTGIAQRGDRVLLVTVMNPSAKEHNAVYRESAQLFDWGFAADGKVTPVGELVGPKSDGGTAGSSGGSEASASPGTPADSDRTDAAAGAEGSLPRTTAQGQDTAEGSDGLGIALAAMGGVLIAVAAGVFVANRHWPRKPPTG
jgi:D-alanyl-D-alanine carboxypeptidase (penicillin-binding protein 5/6)